MAAHILVGWPCIPLQLLQHLFNWLQSTHDADPDWSERSAAGPWFALVGHPHWLDGSLLHDARQHWRRRHRRLGRHLAVDLHTSLS